MAAILRFAPSPTGLLHVGGARTAIFNWLLARKLKGSFLLRIEDTDRLRSTREATDQILSAMRWLGLDWDDSVQLQSESSPVQIETANQLLATGKAYRCFCTPAELEEKRKYAEIHKINHRYDGTCRHLSPEQINKNLQENKPFSLRFKVEPGIVKYTDLIHGETEIDNDTLDDFILLRSDGSPTYQLAVVTDDHTMGITHIIRGDDHISNTNKQILLYRALDWEEPVFAHIPLILGPDKVRLSKRHGAASVEEFREQGILPEALFNYLCLLGWAPGDDREIMNREELINAFVPERINHSPAVFDYQKLLWMNAKYLSNMALNELMPYVNQWLQEQNLKVPADRQDAFKLLVKLLQPRSQTIRKLTDQLIIFFRQPDSYEEKGVKKYFNKATYAGLLFEITAELKQSGSTLFNNIEELEKAIRSFAEKRDVSAGKVIHPLRLALTGKTTSPGIFEMLYILGYNEVINRLDRAINYIREQVMV